MIPHIILIMQGKNFQPIAFVWELCVCNEDGNIAVFPDLESAISHRDEHEIDGKGKNKYMNVCPIGKLSHRHCKEQTGLAGSSGI